ncbi:MAG: hypothetical protein PHX01_05510 [Clostridia bacterium]|nr:hypothetical protein [Clostridia bacterium]
MLMSYPGDRRPIKKNVRKRETKAEAAKVQKINASVKPKETVSKQAKGMGGEQVAITDYNLDGDPNSQGQGEAEQKWEPPKTKGTLLPIRCR